MRHKQKALWLTAIAVLAFGAVSVSAAQASPHFTSKSATTYVYGQQESINVMSFAGGEFECEGVELEGGPFTGKELSTLALHPTYTDCRVFGQTMDVETTGCVYEVSAAGGVQIDCATSPIAFTWPMGPCTLEVDSQTISESTEPETPIAAYENNGSAIAMTWSLGGIDYTSSGGFCGPSGSNASIVGSFVLKGFANKQRTVPAGIGWEAS